MYVYAWHAFLGLKAPGRVFATARVDGTQWPTIPNVEHLDTECGGVVTLQSEVNDNTQVRVVRYITKSLNSGYFLMQWM